ncbi:MAG: hypothetical protein AAGA19_15280 [Pseudomonadota bacterium]
MSSVTADYTVSNASEILALFGSWPLSGDTRQVPGGQPVIVRLTGPVSFGLDLSGYKFDHQVTLLGTGPFTMAYSNHAFAAGPYSSSDINGGLIIDDCANLRLFLLYIGDGISAERSQDCVIERCWIDGDHFPATHPMSEPGGGAFGIYMHDTVRVSILDCHFSHWNTANVLESGTVDTLIQGTTSDHKRHDDFKQHSGVTRRTMRGNWSCRTTNRQDGDITDGDAAHTDWNQTQGAGEMIDPVFEFNVIWYGPRLATQGASDQNPDSSQQGIFGGGTGSWTNATITQNFFANNHASQVALNGNGVHTGINVTRNTLIAYQMSTGQGYSVPITEGTNDFNIITTNSNRSGSAGPNGIFYDLGDVKDGNYDFVALAALGHFSGVASDATGFEIAMPSGGAADRAHWANPDPAGAHLLLERVFQDGLHPGNVGWPVSEPWARQYNFNGAIPSSFTGFYDMDGNNSAAIIAPQVLPSLLRLNVQVGP